MLIEYKVANFRSIREEQKLSLVANNADKQSLPSCIIDTDLPGLKGVRFLKGAAIYGPNASGKSNVMDSVSFLRKFVKRSAIELEPGAPTGVVPFKLDQASTNEPTTFEVTFVTEGIRYVYGFSATSQRVVEEYVVAYPKGLPQRWYHRKYDPTDDKYDWGKPSTVFKLEAALQEKTRQNSLFLSVAAQFNHPQLSLVYNWFQKDLRSLTLSGEYSMSPGFTLRMLALQAQNRRILKMLQNADLGVVDIAVSEKELTVEELRKQLPREVIANLESRAELKLGKTQEIHLIHKAEGSDPVPFILSEESAGTRRLLALAGPWTDLLDNGRTLFVDEIETSLHPILVKELLQLIFGAGSNPKGAQIVFTTHNPFLLDSELMRRDQVWFTEKTPAGSTALYPLTDYQPRKDEALAKGYLAGRYGAIPYIAHGIEK